MKGIKINQGELPDLEKQIAWIEAYIQRLKLEIDTDPQDWMPEDLIYQQEILKSLLGARNILDRDEKIMTLKDTSLDSCLNLIKAEKEVVEKFMNKDSFLRNRHRILNAIELNLIALRTFAERLAEQLYKLPGNNGEEAENHD